MLYLKANLIRLRFGELCNLSCEHCIQRTFERYNSYEIDERLSDYLNSSYVTSPNKEYKIQICFIGGEPLLYFDKIKYFVERLSSNKFVFSLITNGKLLSNEIISYCNQHDIAISVSWDGTNSIKHRGYDVIKSNFNNLLKINKLRISSCFLNDSLIDDKISVINKLYRVYYCYNNKEIDNIHFIIPFDYNFYSSTILEFTKQVNKLYDLYQEIPIYNKVIRDLMLYCRTIPNNKDIKNIFSDTTYDYHICCNGDIVHCWYNCKFGNVFDDTFNNIPNNNYKLCENCTISKYCKTIYNKKKYVNSFCKMCKLWYERVENYSIHDKNIFKI